MKERICFLYECRFRNDGSPLFLKTAFERHWEELGLLEPVMHFVPGDEYRGGKFDLYIWPDHGEDGLPVPAHTCQKPNIYWCSDSHLGLEYRLKKAEEFDIVFVTISDHVDIFKKHLGHERVYWLPHAGEPSCYTKHFIVKKYDVSFIGHIPTQERSEYLDEAFRAGEHIFFGKRFFEEAAEIYSASKIVFNHSIAGEANMRAFEATLTGSMMLTNISQDLVKLGFKDKENCVFYSDKSQIQPLIEYYLAHDEEREAIARNGMELAFNNHTYLHRAKQIMDIWRNYVYRKRD